MKWLAWLGCACVALVSVGACSGDEGKKSQRGQDGGAAGEVSTPNGGAAGEVSTPNGGAAGEVSTPNGGAAGEVSTPNGGAAGEPTSGGAGGAPSADISLATLQGTWTGYVLDSYVCESSVQSLQLTIEGSTVANAWLGATGPIEQQAGQAFTASWFIEGGEGPDQNYRAQLFVHPSAQYALYVVQPFFEDGPAGWIQVGVLQKAGPTETTATADDLLGEWQGTGVELDSNFEVIDQFDSTASFAASEGWVLSGNDRDGAFNGIVNDSDEFFSESTYVSQGEEELGVYTLMSADAKVLGVAMIRDLSENNSALCNLDDPFSDMSVHKFALWDKYFD